MQSQRESLKLSQHQNHSVPEQKAALVGLGLKKFNIDIEAFSESRLARSSKLEEVNVDTYFFGVEEMKTGYATLVLVLPSKQK